ncbi:MAG: DUF2344 domain-containing protein [Sedimentisphaerales bacterium]|nr:DUF2344 domain-containing protein [Sedimentisphaerales bacterium]
MNLIDINRQKDIKELIYLVIKFQIKGTLRFISHSQMLSVFQRALVRAGIEPQYSQGFNPRPKISLPLPRPVGVESDDELLVMSISLAQVSIYDSYKDSVGNSENCLKSQFLQNLSAQLPRGCELKSVDMVREKPSFQPCYATYIFTIRQEEMTENLQNRINSLLTSKSLIVERSIDIKSVSKKIDVRGFLISIITEHNSIIVRCKISAAGSIRIQEVMNLLGLDMAKLASPIKRTDVQWQEDK